jgi:hypothetical protein
MPDPGDHLARLRRADSQVKAARVRAALDAMAAGEPPGVSQLARRARVSRRFIYDHPELRAEIAHRATQVAGQCAGVVTASLRADLENAKAPQPPARVRPRRLAPTPRRGHRLGHPQPGQRPRAPQHGRARRASSSRPWPPSRWQPVLRIMQPSSPPHWRRLCARQVAMLVGVGPLGAADTNTVFSMLSSLVANTEAHTGIRAPVYFSTSGCHRPAPRRDRRPGRRSRTSPRALARRH